MTWWINHVVCSNMPFKKGNKLAKGSNGQRMIYHRYISEQVYPTQTATAHQELQLTPLKSQPCEHRCIVLRQHVFTVQVMQQSLPLLCCFDATARIGVNLGVAESALLSLVSSLAEQVHRFSRPLPSQLPRCLPAAIAIRF
jgi:hypothetical protein